MGTVQVNNQAIREETTDQEKTRREDASFTICAPQLLHLDVSGRPIWFNGWLLPNKFSDDKDIQPANFGSFITEPRDVRAIESWKLEENNICCLSSDQLSDFTFTEKSILNQAVEIAKNVGAIRQN